MNEEINLKREHQRLDDVREQPLEMDNKPRQQVIRIIYLITVVDLTCMFMQFGIVPVSMENPFFVVGGR